VVRLRGAVFYDVSNRDDWAAEAPPAREIAAAVMPGAPASSASVSSVSVARYSARRRAISAYGAPRERVLERSHRLAS
jgi:hypothetical protein